MRKDWDETGRGARRTVREKTDYWYYSYFVDKCVRSLARTSNQPNRTAPNNI